ncbi:hypothetical protein HDU86_002342 [Geranomyces michiganensis]|nr:hypothetical protein HDU86_002342 [Geranomyces michiganensis]
MPKRKPAAAQASPSQKPAKTKRTPPKRQTSTIASYFVAATSLSASAQLDTHSQQGTPASESLADTGEGGWNDCPICGCSIACLSTDKATLHVNRCIDGQPDDPDQGLELVAAAAIAEAVRVVPGASKSTSSSSASEAAEQWGDDIGVVEACSQISTATYTGGPVATVMTTTLSEATAYERSHYDAVLDLPAWAPPETPADQPDTPYWKPQNAGSRSCPWFKKMPGTGFTVDAFNFGKIEECTAYFLTDHYGGLTRSFDYGPLYCSAITGNLISQRLRVSEDYIVSLPMETPVMVMGVKVTLIDANHCPGAVLFLFELPDGKRLLHTGDFRACPSHLKHPYLRTLPIDICYLDTTYCAPSHRFPPQEAVINAVGTLCTRIRAGETVQSIVSAETNGSSVVNFLSRWMGHTKQKPQRPLVLVGSYTIGKEKMFYIVAKNLGSGIFVETTKRRVLEQLENPELMEMLTEDPQAAVHVVKMNSLKVADVDPYIKRLKLDPDIVICIRPTGWTFRPTKSDVAAVTAVDDEITVMPSTQALETYTVKSLDPSYASVAVGGGAGNGRPRVVPVVTLAVPYSEHSSFSELEAFVKGVGTNLHRVIPTVGQGDNIKEWCDSWLSARKTAEATGEKCYTSVGPSGF